MATKTIVTNVCDECHSTRRKVDTYRVGAEGILYRLTLCREHARPLVRLAKLGEAISQSGPAGVKLWDIGEIERMKKTQKKNRP